MIKFYPKEKYFFGERPKLVDLLYRTPVSEYGGCLKVQRYLVVFCFEKKLGNKAIINEEFTYDIAICICISIELISQHTIYIVISSAHYELP